MHSDLRNVFMTEEVACIVALFHCLIQIFEFADSISKEYFTSWNSTKTFILHSFHENSENRLLLSAPLSWRVAS